MNILCQGGWFVGQSALLDWLDGFEEVHLVPGEHELFRRENGIFDLLAENDTVKKVEFIDVMKNNAVKDIYRVIKSFIAFKSGYAKRRLYATEIITRWENKKTAYHYTTTHALIWRYLSIERRKLLGNQSFNEIEHWKSWLSRFNHIGLKKKSPGLYVHHNPFFYKETFSSHENVWPNFFDPFKLIFIYRDPIDQFADIIRYKAYIPMEHRFYYGKEHLHAADRFFELSKEIYMARLRMAKEYSPNQLIIFSFEDFLQKHQSISEQIKSFLGIHSKWDLNNKRFILEQSLQNIGKGKDNDVALSWLEERPYIMDELYKLHDQLSRLPHTLH
jgi:hypothetical protein